MPISLIANTGLQFHKTNIRFNWNEFRTIFYFNQYWDQTRNRLSLEVAQKIDDQITGDDIYISKNDLKALNLLDNYDRFNGTWDGNADIHRFSSNDIIEARCTTLQKSILTNEQAVLFNFFNQWLPLPCFEINQADRFMVGPFNWARIMVTPTNFNPDNPQNYDIKGSQDWNITIAFDTTTVFADGNYTNQFRESPLFANRFERKKTFGIPSTDMSLMNFVAPPDGNSEWIEAGILKLVHNTSDLSTLYEMFPHNDNNLPPLYTFLAAYIYFLHIVASKLSDTKIELVNSLNQPPINVNLVVDMGNSKTTAVLFEEGHFDKVAMVELQDFSQPFLSEKSPFDMNVVFDRADFGICKIGNSSQFIHPSLVRLGREATRLRYQAGLENGLKYSSCSSPKRYLWDKHPSLYEWQNIRRGNNDPEPISLKGISNQFNGDGSLSATGYSGDSVHYSRRSLMTFAFLEILAQAYRQINSQQFRNDNGENESPRRISKILVTCPTAMSRLEQIELRTAAAEAYTVLNRYYNHTDKTPLNYQQTIYGAPVKPSLRDLTNWNNEHKWLYDEATCVQFVYICAEVAERYKNNCEEFFKQYGKLRNDIFEANSTTPYKKNSLTIGSVDIGAGTTDLMICSYKYNTVGQTTLTPVPHYWESFYTAGDDILKAFVQEIIIEGPNSMVESTLVSQHRSPSDIAALIADFFGKNNARINVPARQLRREFCQQISVPIAQFFLEKTRLLINKQDLKWNDIFSTQNQPNPILLDKFYQHFGFRIEEQTWHYSLNVTTQIINNVMDGLLKKISAALAEYDCDILLLAGRPCSLKPIEDIFMKYYTVAPNRLKVLNEYRVGRWYPFQDGNGFFENQKSVVAVGALIGYICSELGGYKGLSLNLDELGDKMAPTSNYIGLLSNPASSIIPSRDLLFDPDTINTSLSIPSIPINLGCRQLNTESYPARPLYTFDFNDDAIRKAAKSALSPEMADDEIKVQDFINTNKEQIRQKMPLTIELDRDYNIDREKVSVIDIRDHDDKSLPNLQKKFFSLQIKSLSESDSFWLDDGAFNCKIAAQG